LSTLLVTRRFVSVVGTGGMGKTTVAICVGHALLDAFSDAAYFVDLSAVADPALVPSVVAAALGVAHMQEPLTDLLAFLADRRVLLILDNCEHVVGAAALLAERLYIEAPHVHILTTSREALRVEGEHVHLLAPLDCPPPSEQLTAAEALAASAVQLFMDRAFAAGYTAELTDAEAPVVVGICSRLDGIAFAIELAASRVATYGIRGTADLLNNRFKLLWLGRRSAPPRQQTLAAMLDWSVNLLSDRDRLVLGRLSIFVGAFTLEAAQGVASDDHTEPVQVAAAVASLVDKSLMLTSAIGGVSHYRLLDSTLAYAAEKLGRSVDAAIVARKHALYYEQWLPQDGPDDARSALAAPHMGDVRAALEWCFGLDGDVAVGLRLAAAAAPIFFGLSLLVDTTRWCSQGLSSLPPGEKGNKTHLRLQAFLAASKMITRGNGDDVRRSIEDAVGLAEALGEKDYRTHLVVGLGIFLHDIGDFRGALALAQRSIAETQSIDAPGVIAAGESALGVAYHAIGDQIAARRHCERGLRKAEAAGPAQVAFFGFDHEIRALITLARCYWLIGQPDRAAETARRAIDLAATRDHPVNLCMTFICTATVFLWRGDLDEAGSLVERLIVHAARHSLGPYRTLGLALRGELAIARGDPAEGSDRLRRALEGLQAEKHHVLTPALHATLADGLLKAGEIEDAASVVEEGLKLSKVYGESLSLPELLRVRGEIWLQTTPPDLEAAERSFSRALRTASGQSTLSLELRSAMGLARLWSSRGRTTAAVELLGSVRQRFTEGFQTADLRRADQLLATLQQAGDSVLEAS
jgi:predicted ATPase